MLLLSIAAAIFDLRSRRIPNWLVVSGLVSGFALNGMLAGLTGLGSSLLGFGLALLIYVPLFMLRAMGGGDVKLMAALGSLCGPHNWLILFVFASLVGGISAIVVILGRRAARSSLTNTMHIFREVAHGRMPFRSNPALDIAHDSSISIPHGVTIAAGVMLFLYSLRP